MGDRVEDPRFARWTVGTEPFQGRAYERHPEKRDGRRCEKLGGVVSGFSCLKKFTATVGLRFQYLPTIICFAKDFARLQSQVRRQARGTSTPRSDIDPSGIGESTRGWTIQSSRVPIRCGDPREQGSSLWS